MNTPLLKRDPAHEYMSFDNFEELLQDKPEDALWELINGRVIRGMVGAVFEHHAIIGNLDLANSNHLRQKGRECRTYRETFYLKERIYDLSALPDFMVRCGPHPRGAKSVDDPMIIVEIVSPGSVKRDRLEKRVAYQALPSLQTYVLIERDQVTIDAYERTPAGFVGNAPLQQATNVLKLPAIEFEMPFAELYRDVFFSS